MLLQSSRLNRQLIRQSMRQIKMEHSKYVCMFSSMVVALLCYAYLCTAHRVQAGDGTCCQVNHDADPMYPSNVHEIDDLVLIKATPVAPCFIIEVSLATKTVKHPVIIFTHGSMWGTYIVGKDGIEIQDLLRILHPCFICLLLHVQQS